MTHHNQTKELTTWFLNGEEGHGGGHGEDCGRSCRGLAGPRPCTLNGRGQEGGGSKWLHPTSQMSLMGCLETSVCPASSLFFGASFSDYISFLPSSSPSGVATMMGMAASAIGTAATDAAVRATPGMTPDGEPRTPEGVFEDMVEDSELESEVAPEPVPEVVRDEAPSEGAMIAVHMAAAPPPSCGA
jgi:hypothetical protein